MEKWKRSELISRIKDLEKIKEEYSKDYQPLIKDNADLFNRVARYQQENHNLKIKVNTLIRMSLSHDLTTGKGGNE